MQRKQTWFAALGAAVVLSAAYYAGNLWATPAKGFSATTLALGRFGDIEVFNHFIQPSTLDEDEKRIWLSWQKTKGGVRPVRPEQRLGARRKHWLALAPRA